MVEIDDTGARFHRPDGSIEVVPHDPRWAREFERADREIGTALEGLAVRVHHVGSTSVPGLAAKPTIDVLVEYEPDVDRDAMIDRLERAGFEHRPGAFPDADHLFFRRVTTAGKRSHHLHALPHGSETARDQLLLRDHLRSNPDAAREYESAKWELLRQTKTRAEYRAEKATVVASLLARARPGGCQH